MSFCRRLLPLLLLLAPLVEAVPAFADGEAAEVTSAGVVITASGQLVDRAGRKKLWKKACDALGKALSAGGDGPWGFGVFSAYRCDTASADFGRGPTETRWHLHVALRQLKTTERALVLTMSQDGVPDTDTKLVLGKAMEPLELLADAELARRIAFAVSANLPMLARIAPPAKKKGDADGDAAGPSDLEFFYPPANDPDLDDAAAVPAPPKVLNLYGLRWDNTAKLWRPRIVGAARLAKLTKPTSSTKGRAVYELEPAASRALAKEGLWAHDGRGAGVAAKEWEDATRDAHAELAEAQEDRLSSPLIASANDLVGFAGFRYGRQILTGNKLLESTSFFGLLLELRAGPLSGLQYYYDVLPSATYAETSVTDQPVKSSIEWQRHVLGYTFRFPFPWLIDRITLTPKIGVWNLQARIPGPPDELGRVEELREFEIKKAISVGAEAGMEVAVSRFALRPWGGIDSGYSPFGDGKRVTSRRVGLDTYVAGPNVGFLGSTVRFALLGFLFVENVSLQSDAEQAADVEVSEDGVKRTTARRIEYNAGYAGLGLALSW